jgi:hypothetical protein
MREDKALGPSKAAHDTPGNSGRNFERHPRLGMFIMPPLIVPSPPGAASPGVSLLLEASSQTCACPGRLRGAPRWSCRLQKAAARVRPSCMVGFADGRLPRVGQRGSTPRARPKCRDHAQNHSSPRVGSLNSSCGIIGSPSSPTEAPEWRARNHRRGCTNIIHRNRAALGRLTADSREFKALARSPARRTELVLRYCS